MQRKVLNRAYKDAEIDFTLPSFALVQDHSHSRKTGEPLRKAYESICVAQSFPSNYLGSCYFSDRCLGCNCDVRTNLERQEHLLLSRCRGNGALTCM